MNQTSAARISPAASLGAQVFLLAERVTREALAQLGRTIKRCWQIRHTDSPGSFSVSQDEQTISLRITFTVTKSCYQKLLNINLISYIGLHLHECLFRFSNHCQCNVRYGLLAHVDKRPNLGKSGHFEAAEGWRDWKGWEAKHVRSVRRLPPLPVFQPEFNTDRSPRPLSHIG